MNTQRAMGLDVGTKTIGVAISDPSYLIAQAMTTIHRTKLSEDLDILRKWIEDYQIAEIVVGFPKHMNNDIGKSAQRARSFAQACEEAFHLPVYLQDERCTTLSAERVLKETKVRRENRKKVIDAIAATFILQTWLDARRYQ